MIYFDNNATTKVLPEVLEAMLPYFSEKFFNSTSAVGNLHSLDQPLSDACASLALLLDCDPEEIVLTSGATEANNWVLQSVAVSLEPRLGPVHVIVSAIEHPSILEVVSFLATKHPALHFDLVPVMSDGVVDLDAFRALLRPDTALVSVMLANNETGVIQPISEIAALSKDANPDCLVHTDATQAIGKIPVNLAVDLRSVDLLSLSAHKFNGPKGAGALFIRSGIDLVPFLHGGGQQRGLRAGTDNPALAAGLAKAAEIARSRDMRMTVSSNQAALELGLRRLGLRILGDTSSRLPNTSLILFPGLDSDLLVHEFLAAGFATSTGSACMSGSDAPSHVVLAMGVDYAEARGAVRISLGHENTQEEITQFLRTVSNFTRLRRQKTKENGSFDNLLRKKR